MLEIDNYADIDENKYPCLSIDWITDFEKRFIQEKFSNYNSSLDEISDLNNSTGTLDELYMPGGEFDNEADVEDTESIEDLFGGIEAGLYLQSEDGFDDIFSDGGEDGFGIFGSESLSSDADEVSLDELMSIVDEPLSNREPEKDVKSREIFGDRLPIYVDNEKIAEAVLNKESLSILNHFFKRKWVLEISEIQTEELNEEFIIKNIFNLV